MSFDLELFERERRSRELTLGAPSAWRDETESTNDDALSAAKNGAPHGALFGAEAQTRGRGRRGSEWLSAPGAGLWFSLVLRPELRAELAPALALCAGLAVQRAVASRAGARVLVKWPNDVLADGRKLAGVLVESQIAGSRLASVIVGIGVNVHQASFPEPIATVATSLELLGAADTQREPLLADILRELEARSAELAREGTGAIAAALRDHDALWGKRVRVDGVDGVGAGIDDAGRLLLRGPDGALTPVVSGHVEMLP